MAEDITDEELWKREYEPVNYIVQTAANVGFPKKGKSTA